jgi:DNA-directed RNA polymerase subunit M/transcription elongation factor TFIIS
MQACIQRILNPVEGWPRKRDFARECMLPVFLRTEEFRALDDTTQYDIVSRVESSIFACVCANAAAEGIVQTLDNAQFIHRYSIACNMVLSNASVLVPRLCAHIDMCDRVGEMNAQDLNPDANVSERDEIQRRRDQKIEEKVSKQYRCRKCGHDETIPLQYQSRALDEGGSLSIRCVKCGNVQRG